MAEGEHYSYFSIVLNNRPIVLNPKSHPGILIEVILIKQKRVTGKILGVNSIEKEARCSLCKRKARINDDGKVYCEPCDFKTSKGKSIMSWFVKLRFVAEGYYRLLPISC